MPRRGPFTHPRCVLTEGHEDAALIRKLIEVRGIQPFDVSPNVDIGQVGGNSGFFNAITALEPLAGFSNVKHVVLVADNDDNAAASFAGVTSQLTRAQAEIPLTRNWGLPVEPYRSANGDPAVSAWMWPKAEEPGCMETILWKVIQDLHKEAAACADAACACAEATTWPLSKLDKARVRCFLALVFKKNPAIALANLWRDAPELLPVTHGEFDVLEAYLRAV